MKKLTGQCLCGAIAYEINGKLGPIAHCHCLRCRRWHGAAFRTRAAVKKQQFQWTKGEECLAFYQYCNDRVKTFCKICGSNLISYSKTHPDSIGLPIGGLDQCPGARPTMHIFVDSKAPWYDITDSLEQYATWPPMGPNSVRIKKQ